MNTRKICFLTCFALAMITHLCYGQKQLSITLDDPNTYPTPLLSWEERNDRILTALDKHKVQAALFVCGMRVDDENGKKLLTSWDGRNHLICNHSYSHPYYHSKSVTVPSFIRDFQKGDSLIRHYSKFTRLFRFPYLKEGNSIPKRDSMRAQLRNLGYQNGYVTIDASDWYIDSRMSDVLKKDPKTDVSAYKDYYLRHILNRAGYYDSLSRILNKRSVPHTLLLHHSLLNALFLDDLITALKSEGWNIIHAKDAYKDKLFQSQPAILPCGESLIWQLAHQDSNLKSSLRYPAEDSQYETKPLDQFLQNHATPKASPKPKLIISHLTDQFYVYTTFNEFNGSLFPSNSMYVVTKDGVVLIDTPWDTTQFQPLLDSIWARHQKKVVMAMATHFHSDRTAGLVYYQSKGIPTYTSRQTHKLCIERKEPLSDRIFEKDTVFNVGGYRFHTYYPGKGHTADNIVVWFDRFRVLYGGCLVKSTENQSLGNVADANVKEWDPTMRKLIRKYPDARFVIPGHFSWKNNQSLKHTLRLLGKMEK